MRRTLADLRASRIPNRLGVCATDPRVLQWANSAMERLITLGHWWGTCQRMLICATDGCITMPREVATLEAVAICNRPVPIHDFWFEFLENGGGIRTTNSCWREANYRGRFPTFNSIIGLNKKLNFVCDVPDDIGKQVLALGYDQNLNWIRTQQNGVWSDGELIAYAQGAGTNSVNLFSSVTDLQIPATMAGQSWLYEYDTTALTQRLIGHYQAGETRPAYGRYFFPSINSSVAAQSPCGTIPIEAMAKLEFIPLVNDTDYLIIGNLPALEEMMVALMRAEDQTDSVSANTILATATTTARGILDAELDHYLGSGRRIGIDIVGSSIGEVDPVENFV